MWGTESEGGPMRTVLCAILLTATLGGVGHSATISIDKSTRYQTIDGLGAGIHYFRPWKRKVGPFYETVDLDAVGFYDTVVKDLGISLIRILEDGDFESDSGVYVTTDYMARQLTHTRKFLAAAQRQNEELVVITSVLSPPGYMKVSGQTVGGIEAAPNYFDTDCRLKDGYDDEYATFCTRYMQRSRDSLGVELYAFSIQNEPAFQEPYASCVFNAQRYAQTLKAVGQQVRAAGLTTRFFGAEHMSWAFPNVFENYIRQDPDALQYMYAWAVHGYTDGNSADTGSYSGPTTTDKGLWMSETSGSVYGDSVYDWSGALTLGNNMLSFLRGGRISAWNYLHIMENSGGGSMDIPGSACLYVDGQRTSKFYVAHHFYRYIRPGARQIASSTDDSELGVVAFWHEDNQCMSIVLLNKGAQRTVTGITGDLPAEFTVVTSDETAQLTTSTAAPGDPIVLPAASITTLVAGSYMGSGTAAARPRNATTVRRAVHTSGRASSLFAIDGRRVPSGMNTRRASGVYLAQDAVRRRLSVQVR
ncbi:MAG: hypothetical protein GF331_09465 [Chitinivibrionales bacterium]|nr:hypothetical protein [Chitinivibrionales bacterium]